MFMLMFKCVCPLKLNGLTMLPRALLLGTGKLTKILKCRAELGVRRKSPVVAQILRSLAVESDVLDCQLCSSGIQ
jgi:hypothetical protein